METPMSTIRDTLINLRPLEIPRPQVSNFQFISTRGRYGFYKSVRKQGAKYGVEIKTTAPRRTPLSQAYWYDCVKEANSEVPSKISVIDEQPLENPSENHLRITNDKSVSDCMKISDFAKSTHHLWLDSLRWLRIMFWTNVLSKSPLIDFLL